MSECINKLGFLCTCTKVFLFANRSAYSPLWCFLGGWWGSWERRKWIHCLSPHHKAGGQWSLPVSTGCPRKGWGCPHQRTSQGWGSSSPSETAGDQRERKQMFQNLLSKREIWFKTNKERHLKKKAWLKTDEISPKHPTIDQHYLR